MSDYEFLSGFLHGLYVGCALAYLIVYLCGARKVEGDR